jgi:protein-S-isoprenylcysteine O-methyltransferase Ste14
MALLEEFEAQGLWLFRYRSTLPLVLLLAGLSLFLYGKISHCISFIEGSSLEIYFNYLCLIVSLFGLFIRVFTVGHTPKNTSGRNTAEQLADSLNTSGAYSLLRHPLYLGNFFMWLGPAMLTGNWWFIAVFCFIYWVYYERIMFAEEQFLRSKFSSIYTDWAKNIPAFIPNFKNYKKSNISFSWKKVLKKEKNGLVATFMIFSLFDICGNLVKGSNDFDYVLIAMSGITIITYLILRYLKHNTKVLDEEDR